MNNKDDFFDVGEKYFGVSIDNNKLEQVLCNDMCCDLQNILIKREEAVKFIEEIYKSEDGAWYCSKDAIKGRDIKDYIGRQIFHDDIDNLNGWIFMWDKNMNEVKDAVSHLAEMMQNAAEALENIKDTVNESASGVADIAGKTSDMVEKTTETHDMVAVCYDCADRLKEIVNKFVLP